MELLTNSLEEVIEKLSDSQKEKIYITESIICVNSSNKEQIKEKVFKFFDDSKEKKPLQYILERINYAASIRPKERQSILYLFNSIREKFEINFQEFWRYTILQNMLPETSFFITSKHIFDFSEENTIERYIYEDDVDNLQQFLAIPNTETRQNYFSIEQFFPGIGYFFMKKLSNLEIAALFGSLKCFKFLLMNGEEIKGKICEYAIIGGSYEIVHLCEQKGMKFEKCLNISVQFHRFDLFEWLNSHFNYERLSLDKCILYYNEPIIYLLITNSPEGKDESGIAPVNWASLVGHLEIVKYLYEKYHVDIETESSSGDTPIISASFAGNLDVVKYLYEECHADVERKNKYGENAIIFSSCNGHIDVVKYLYEHCHVDVNAKDNDEKTPLIWASSRGRFEVVKYLVEHCHVNITDKTISSAKTGEIENYLRYKLAN